MQAPPNSDLYSSQRSNGMWNTSSFPIVLKILRASDVDQRMMSFETIPSFSSLDSLVHKLYDISSNEELQYTYYDTDGDCISVKTNDDLENMFKFHPSITSLIPFTPQQVKIGMVDTDRELTSTEKSIKFPEETRVNEKQKKAVLHRIRELRRKNRETRTEKEKTRLISTKSEQMQQLELFTREEYKYLGSEKRIKTMRRLLCELGKERREEATIQRRRRRQQRRERLEKYQMQRMLGAHRTGPLDEDSDESGSNDSETGSHRHERSSLASEDGGSNISELSYSQVSEDTDSDKEHLNEEDMAKLDNHDEISDEDELRDVLIQTLRMKSNEDFFNDQAQVLAQQYKQKKRERTRRTQLIEKEREDYLNVAKDALTESESEETEEESETEPESFSDGFGEEDSIEAQNRHDEMRRERDEEERRGKREESQFNSGEGSSEEEEEIGEEDD
ncbi:hypothetical protein BLNAU_4172 [Blattamonas nauphoetae]|uniref:PB1 domain-containing protein n=1 Tax=Blattamonas nauphoetae TaxID=2049346 RepID=A0ABQ9YAI3_9EUKA|nr:hypothetical protein BLNAU_4172 [Blattamonas nauphoetae]